MKRFDVLRYIKNFYLLILLLAIVGAYGIYNYGEGNQSYTATAVVRYTNAGATDGLAPNGATIKVEEIYSSTVIDDAVSALGLGATLDSIRSRFDVQEVIPDEQKRINDALISKGETPTYHATEYKVTFTADGTKSADYARDVMDAVLQSYMSFYSEKYVEQSVLQNGVLDLEGKDYDCIETAEILEGVTATMIGYLKERMESFPDSRSSQTGYTYEDLYYLYDHLYNYEIPRIYAVILSDSETKDRELMIDKQNNNIAQYELRIKNLETQAANLKALIDNYSDSNKSMLEHHYVRGDYDGDGVDDSRNTDYILKMVDDNKEAANVQTTYDNLLQEYTDIRLQIELMEIKKAHSEYLLTTFRSMTGNNGNDETITGLIARYVGYMNEYYNLVKTTGTEINEFLSAKYLKMVSTIKVGSAVNIKLYVVLALGFFTVVGILGAIVLGRMIDIVDYLLYVDKRVELPNRASCDRRVDELAEELLPENFSFIYIHFTALQKLTEKLGRVGTDKVLLDFSKLLKSFSANYGFIGYNGNGQYLAFFENCNDVKREKILHVLRKYVDEYNAQNPEHQMEYDCFCANSTEDKEYEIRPLMRIAFSRSSAAGRRNG